MSGQFLDFEQPIEELNQKIQALRMVSGDNSVNLGEEISRLEAKSQELMTRIFAKLEPWQVVQMARHPRRPQTSEYLEGLFTDFQELHGDRHESEAPAIIAGLARFNDEPVVVIGHQKGKRTKEKVRRNFGMARPEEYRRALRLMHMAEKFQFPIMTFIDTAGAYPGIEAEERNQSEAIARNLFEMSALKTPIICVVTGEAGSGGALAIGVGDRVIMLQYAIYSVISPEGCASILWKDAARADEAARAMGVTANTIFDNQLIDRVIEEPLGGAHRDPDAVMTDLKQVLEDELAALRALSVEDLLAERYKKLMALGACGE
ncbi:MAG: acetyl-CoA carboxylase carboxyltransferase subunit alpha [Gammaproteobacteria bacterium]|nr:acetyl-CoA carboxylase carboxyltransferase subunit alpha [Gammaproteobacteria bacterium]MCH9764027.1 acetyl-CoA carboxylase carboxyltransferase subunit alpha [Gammaproteobacteria bacterium]